MNQKKTLPEPLSIVMPVCNEADVLEGVIEEWVEQVFKFLPEGSEFLIDEAASTDGTRQILERLGRKYPFLKTEFHPMKEGFGVATKRLYARAKNPLIFFTDSDGQYVASEFWRLAPHAGSYAVIHGAKIGRQDTFFRKAASAVFNRIARFVFDVHYSDINSAFRIVRREVVLELLPRLHCLPTLVNAEILLRAELENLPIKQVHVLHRKRRFGVSRGLAPHKFLGEAFRAYLGLLALKKEYRIA